VEYSEAKRAQSVDSAPPVSSTRTRWPSSADVVASAVATTTPPSVSNVRAVHRLEARQPAGQGDLADDRPVGGVEREQPQIRARPVRVDEDVEAQC